MAPLIRTLTILLAFLASATNSAAQTVDSTCSEKVSDLCSAYECKCGVLVKQAWDCAVSHKERLASVHPECGTRIDMELKVREVCTADIERLGCQNKLVSSCLRSQKAAVSGNCASEIESLHGHELQMFHSVIQKQPEAGVRVRAKTGRISRVGNRGST